MGPIVGIGFGPSTAPGYVVTLGFGYFVPPATGPGYVEAFGVYVPGAEAFDSYAPGPEAFAVYSGEDVNGEIHYGTS